MEDKLRKRPYVWTSWLTKLLAGEDRCWWKAWYKSHYKAAKLEDEDRADFFAEWTKKHDVLTARKAAAFRNEGYVTRVESQAEFKLVGKVADLAGKPDLVAIKDGRAIVVDAKSGKKRSSDHWQVLVYLFGLPLAWTGDLALEGALEYPDGEEEVRPLGKREREAIVAAVVKVSGDDVPEHAPSPNECKYCDVAACEERYASPEGDASRFF